MGKKKKQKKGNDNMNEEIKETLEEETENPDEAVSEEEEAKAGDVSESKEADAETSEETDENPEEGSDEEEKKNPLQEKIEELEDKVKRQLAEFDNYRKRTEKEKDSMFEAGARSVIEKLLPVVDNFERGLASIPEEEQGSAHAEGMMMIYKQLMGELEKLDVKPIEAVGCEFNPELHNAVMQCESDEYESGIVAQELQKGYMYRDTVIRHSMVAVVS